MYVFQDPGSGSEFDALPWLQGVMGNEGYNLTQNRTLLTTHFTLGPGVQKFDTPSCLLLLILGV